MKLQQHINQHMKQFNCYQNVESKRHKPSKEFIKTARRMNSGLATVETNSNSIILGIARCRWIAASPDRDFGGTVSNQGNQWIMLYVLLNDYTRIMYRCTYLYTTCVYSVGTSTFTWHIVVLIGQSILKRFLIAQGSNSRHKPQRWWKVTLTIQYAVNKHTVGYFLQWIYHVSK